MMVHLVSIIVPCYNQAQYLDECLQSVFNQTYQNWECIIVNDGSSDHTREIALNWVTRSSRFRYFEKENGGVSSARNFGVSKSVGIYILPLDGDDKISENFISLCEREFAEDPKVELVYGQLVKFGLINNVFKSLEYNYEKLLHHNLFPCTALISKERFVEIGGYDTNAENGFEDWEFWIRMLNSQSKVVCVENCQLFYRIQASSRYVDISKDEYKKQLSKDYIYYKHKDKFTKKSESQLFFEHRELSLKWNNLEKSISYKQLFILIFKKIRRSINVKLSIWER